MRKLSSSRSGVLAVMATTIVTAGLGLSLSPAPAFGASVPDGTWQATGSMVSPQGNIALTRLADGRVLAVSGDGGGFATPVSELFDPATGQWRYTGSLSTSRRNPVVIKLKNGDVLAATGAHGPPDGNRFLFTAELYKPATGQWSYTGPMDIGRDGGSRGVLLHDGRVLVLGGEGPWLTLSPQVDLYNPATGQWALTGSIAHGVGGPTLTVLKNGDVLMAGGSSNSGAYADAEIYDPSTGLWTPTGSMHFARTSASAVLLGKGGVLMAGGYDQNGPTTAAEIYHHSPLVLGQWPGPAGPAVAAADYGYPYPDPPACTDGGACVADQWDFFQGQCTSWVAYRLNQLNGIAFSDSFGGSGIWGSADNWGPHAQSLGIVVDSTPALGSVAWYSSGHVGYVERVNSPTSVVISEMNYDFDNGFRVRTITTTHGWPTAFVHVADR